MTSWRQPHTIVPPGAPADPGCGVSSRRRRGACAPWPAAAGAPDGHSSSTSGPEIRASGGAGGCSADRCASLRKSPRSCVQTGPRDPISEGTLNRNKCPAVCQFRPFSYATARLPPARPAVIKLTTSCPGQHAEKKRQRLRFFRFSTPVEKVVENRWLFSAPAGPPGAEFRAICARRKGLEPVGTALPAGHPG